MPVTLINPPGLAEPPVGAYHHVAIASGTRHVYVAGQIARDATGAPVATGDLAGQVEQAYRNIAVALEAAGATFADVVRLTFYVVDWSAEKFEPLVAGINRATEELGVTAPPASLIEVVSLFEPDVLVEILATAVVD
ncbi:enamine deaminase RidA (YjgF/YER057c/UK114 family) [Nocardioides sp. J9]|uniref:RidA family protein n=1 Tax=Nocardioides sp. J9 TaxID=935844 RepID=UPI0011A9ADC9|nr:RidA family protein [Nocardioides sp. J9]TWH02692.1 enamine deaminase RidA (YjgF/YER057c/UK114 family) [Nocardioides sp. J9]